MAYVISEPCIGAKDNSCVEVCPVDCIHPTPDESDYDAHEQLYIDPAESSTATRASRRVPSMRPRPRTGTGRVAAIHRYQRRVLPPQGGMSSLQLSHLMTG